MKSLWSNENYIKIKDILGRDPDVVMDHAKSNIIEQLKSITNELAAKISQLERDNQIMMFGLESIVRDGHDGCAVFAREVMSQVNVHE